jgi:hypothetical protein
MRWPAARLAYTPTLSVRLKDGKVHTARIVFQPPVLSVFLDGSIAPVLKTAVDLSIVMDPQRQRLGRIHRFNRLGMPESRHSHLVFRGRGHFL